ncbi:MAG: cytochrome d ubiquinol oxidase subunit II [Owenweeksia sp.]|nr:cytochrome d ubiquinol oxidase subunit II [Owenweeksia sp.]
METFLGLDYPTLWFIVIGGLFSGYAVLDGFDLGAGFWHLFFKKEESRRVALNAVGPVWDGNEVWLVIGGGALFAGFPKVYASLFSAMYLPFMLFLIFLIFRAISIEFRSKEEMKWWRQFWDVSYSVASSMLAFLLGVVVGNVLNGFNMDANGQVYISLPGALNPFSVLVGFTTLALFAMHGGIFLSMKTEGRLFSKITRLIKGAMIAFIVLFAISTLYALLSLPHMSDRISQSPVLFLIPLAAFLSIANIPRLLSKRKFQWAFIFSSITTCLSMVIVAVELYPTILYAPANPDNSLTVYNAASSEKSLGIMLLMAAIGFPLVLFYTIFVYRTFWGKVKLDETSY